MSPKPRAHKATTAHHSHAAARFHHPAPRNTPDPPDSVVTGPGLTGPGPIQIPLLAIIAETWAELTERNWI